MVSNKKTSVKERAGKPKLKKETIRDLDAKRRSSDVRGGQPDTYKITASCIHNC